MDENYFNYLMADLYIENLELFESSERDIFETEQFYRISDRSLAEIKKELKNI